jgi:hypothetical protein
MASGVDSSSAPTPTCVLATYGYFRSRPSGPSWSADEYQRARAFYESDTRKTSGGKIDSHNVGRAHLLV